MGGRQEKAVEERFGWSGEREGRKEDRMEDRGEEGRRGARKQ